MQIEIEHILQIIPQKDRIRGPWHYGWSFRLADRYRLWGLLSVFRELSGALLDYGCGDKPYEQYLRQSHITSWDGVDLSKRTSGESYESRADRHLENDRIPYGDGAYDIVLATQVFEHVADLDTCLSEISRVLRNGGTLVTTCPMTSPLHEVPHDYRRITPYGMATIAKKHSLRLERSIALGGPISTIATLCACYLGPVTKIPAIGPTLRWLIGGTVLSIGYVLERLAFSAGLRQTTLTGDFLYLLRKSTR